MATLYVPIVLIITPILMSSILMWPPVKNWIERGKK